MFVIAVILATVTLIDCDNIHRRGIFYSDYDNICFDTGGTFLDIVELNIIIDG